ncbi:MAG: hypothetical protein NPIRA05_23300 [Nitrospirales bacterium]|nr:MAG: hypothetical protein NPIRA05_23300 [Nitrospirales bacterium]
MKMKAITIHLILVVGLAWGSSVAWASGDHGTFSLPENSQAMGTWTAESHVVKAKAAKEKFEILEEEIDNLQTKINKFSQKPHLDTKGFKRQGLRLWKGKLVNELRQIADRIVWHEAQAHEMLASQDDHQQDS